MRRNRRSEHSDPELLDLSRQGDETAFAELWERHSRAGTAAARAIAPRLDADDLVSGAYLKIFEMLRAGKGPTGAFRPYLYRVISSLAADTHRSPEISSDELDTVPDLTETDPWEDGAFDLNAATRAFESLPERWQAALWYSEVEGLAPRHIAPLLGLSANGVSALCARAKEGLQSAWVETHVHIQLSDAACRSTRKQLQRYQRGKLTSARHREVEAHLTHCGDCTAVASEFSMLNQQLALVLATVFVGGSAALLTQQLGTAGPNGAESSGAQAAVISGATSGTAGGTLGGSAAFASGSAVGSAGGSIIAVAVAAALVLAASVGGLLLADPFGWDSASPPSEAASEPADAGAADSTENSKQREAEERSDPGEPQRPLDGENAAATAVNRNPGAGTGTDQTAPITPTTPVEPQPEAPIELVAGYECFVPDLVANTFELVGTASTEAVVEIGFTSLIGAYLLQVNSASDGSWSSGAMFGLEAFLNGSTAAEVRHIDGADAGEFETAAASQCPGSGPTIDTGLQLASTCYLEPTPGAILLSGELSEYGVLFARHLSGGVATPVADPQFDGTPDPTNPAVVWSGILTGADRTPPYFWWAPMPLEAYLGSAASYNAGSQGEFQLRIETPDARSSLWLPIGHLVECS